MKVLIANRRRWLWCLTAALAALGQDRATVLAGELLVIPGPLFQQATNEFASMKRTLYQHATRVDETAGSYCFDCVGFVSHALRKAAPQAWQSVQKVTELPPHRIPSPPKYRAFLADLALHPQPGWLAVTNAAELRPGDLVAWEHKTATASGHAVIIGSRPMRTSDGAWVVEVYDSTSSPHSEDSRPTDPRAEVLATTGRPSGLGHGVMVLEGKEPEGALTGLRWSTKAKAVTVPIAAGRPVF